MDEAQVGEIVAGGAELHGDQAGYAARKWRNPGENEAAGSVYFQVLTGVFDDAAVALHHDAQPANDTKIDVGFDGADRRHPFLQEIGIRPPAEDLADRGRQAAMNLDCLGVDHRRFRARSLR